MSWYEVKLNVTKIVLVEAGSEEEALNDATDSTSYEWDDAGPAVLVPDEHVDSSKRHADEVFPAPGGPRSVQ